MDEALVRHYAGDYSGSNVAIERALVIIDDRYTKSISRAVFSLATSDRKLAYDPNFTERSFLHYYGALNYLALGDPLEAAVEARRLAYLLDQADETDLRPAEIGLRRSMRYFSGIVFEAAGELNDAAVAYRQVWGADVELELSRIDSERPEPGANPVDPPAVPDGLVIPQEIVQQPGFGDVVVLVENGFVAHRVERGVTIPLFADDQRAMQADDDASRLAAAACIANRELADVPGFAVVATDSDPPWSTGEDGACELGSPQAVAAWTEEVSSMFPGLGHSGGDRRRSRAGGDDGSKKDDEDDESEDDESEDEGFYLMRVVWPEIRTTTAAT